MNSSLKDENIQYIIPGDCYNSEAKNQIFNCHFVYANFHGDFPTGWQKGRESKTAAFSWEEEDKNTCSIKISSRLPGRLASIRQERAYAIGVYGKQVWEVGAVFKAHQDLTSTIKVHFISHSSVRVVSSSLRFEVLPGEDYYSALLTVPDGVDYACLELGTKEAGTLWISQVVFKRVFPAAQYDSDPRGRLNINTVNVIKKIAEPVSVTGSIEYRKRGRDIREEVVADSELNASGIQDVLELSTYSFCVINHGACEVRTQLELSPNGTDWVQAGQSDEILLAGQMKILVPDYFLRYIRLLYWTESSSQTPLSIYFQGQG
jgi:predicted secreted protein